MACRHPRTYVGYSTTGRSGRRSPGAAGGEPPLRSVVVDARFPALARLTTAMLTLYFILAVGHMSGCEIALLMHSGGVIPDVVRADDSKGPERT